MITNYTPRTPVSHSAQRWESRRQTDQFEQMKAGKELIKAQQAPEDEETTSTWEKQKSPDWRDQRVSQKDEEPAKTKEWEKQKENEQSEDPKK